MMSNTSYFGTGMQNIEVLPGIGVQRLVLHPEMECTNFFPHWDFGNHFLKIEANLHIKCPDLFSSMSMHTILTIMYTCITTTQNNT